MTTSEDTAAVLNAIRETFAKVSTPFNELNRIAGTDDELGFLFKENRRQPRRWETLSDKEVFANRSSLCFMPPRVWRYYLAAFLTTAIGSKSRAAEVARTVVDQFCVPNNKSFREQMVKRIESLNIDERQMAVRVLKHLAAIHPGLSQDIETALRHIPA